MAKKIKRVVVDLECLELFKRKSALLDDIFPGGGFDEARISPQAFKEYVVIDRITDKLERKGAFNEDPYEEPKLAQPRVKRK